MSFSFQKNVGLYNKGAIAGDRASQNPTVYVPTNFLAGGVVNVGGFVWRDTTNPGTEVVASGSGAPLGFIERTINHDNFAIDVEGTLAIPEEGNVTVAMRGDFYVVADKTVAIGDALLADTTNGSAVFTSSANTVDSGYVAMTAGNEGDLIIVSNWVDHDTLPDGE
jgi:hypothetical protein